MDIEGFEIEAFRHADKMLAQKPIFQISIHPQFIAAKNTTYMEIFEKLKQFNYQIGTLDKDGKFHEIDINKSLSDIRGIDIFAISKDVHGE
jgi:hypothetical protein